jgi:hypothetical protein
MRKLFSVALAALIVSVLIAPGVMIFRNAAALRAQGICPPDTPFRPLAPEQPANGKYVVTYPGGQPITPKTAPYIVVEQGLLSTRFRDENGREVVIWGTFSVVRTR